MSEELKPCPLCFVDKGEHVWDCPNKSRPAPVQVPEEWRYVLDQLARYADTAELFLRPSHPGKADVLRGIVSRAKRLVAAAPSAPSATAAPSVDAEKVMALAAVPEYWLVTRDDGAEWKERNAAQALNLHSAPHVFTVKPVGRVELPPELRAQAPAIANQEVE